MTSNDPYHFKALSVKITKRTIDRARQGLKRVTDHVDEMKQNRKEELEQEYERLVQGLRRAREIEDAGLGGPPVLPNDLLQSGTSRDVKTVSIMTRF